MPDHQSNDPTMDELDEQWVNAFVGKSIPQGSIIEGFIAVISWVDPNGDHQWRSYNTIDARLSHILGLLDMTKLTMMANNQVIIRKEVDDDE